VDDYVELRGIPSMISSRRGIILGLGGAGVLSIIVLFAVSSTPPPAEGDKSSNYRPNDSQTQYFTITQCEDSSIPAAASIVDVDGFLAVQPRTSATPEIVPGEPTPGPRIGIYEFVLQPGSTGNITMTYDFCPAQGQVLGEQPRFNIVNSTEIRNILDETNSTNKEIYLLNEEARASIDRLIYIPPGSSSGVKIYTGEIFRVDEHTVKVVYTISAGPAADEATFITANFYRVCPGAILTIGDGLNEQSLKWASGPFYGCSG
jgi:hypothetical protein